jgi:DNA-binding MarR family transcriptional regulator
MTDIAPLSDDIGFLLTRAGTSLTAAAKTALAPFELRVRSYSVLALACEHSDGLGQRQLAEQLGLDPSQIVALVDDLEVRELITRRVDPGDRRNKRIHATDAGLALCVDAQRALAATQSATLSALGDRGVRELRQSLQSIVRAQ